MRLIIVLLALSLFADTARAQAVRTPAKPGTADGALVLKDAKELADCEGSNTNDKKTVVINLSPGSGPVAPS